jgi:hypothetical protein
LTIGGSRNGNDKGRAVLGYRGVATSEPSQLLGKIADKTERIKKRAERKNTRKKIYQSSGLAASERVENQGIVLDSRDRVSVIRNEQARLIKEKHKQKW